MKFKSYSVRVIFMTAAFLISFGSLYAQSDQIVPLQSGTQNTLNCIWAFDSATAIIVGNGGKIIKTTDEGKSWRGIMSNADKTLESVYFSDSKTGYAAGNFGTIIKTTDAGNTWKKLNSGSEADLKSIYFINVSTGFASGVNGTLLKTLNGGTSWEKIELSTDKWLKDVCFINALKGFIVGWNGVILKTINGGTTWETVESGVDQILESVHFINANDGYVAGWDGLLLFTTDGGSTWEKVEMPVQKNLTDICYVDNENSYIAGFEGALLKSTDGGANWEEQYMEIQADFFSICKFGSTAVLMAGSNGQVVKVVNTEKLKAAELKRYWDDNQDAFDAYNYAMQKYVEKDYKACLSTLDSIHGLLSADNASILELKLKCYFDNGEFANIKKTLPAYDSLKPVKNGDLYRRIDDYNKNIEKYLADEIDWKKAVADSSAIAYDKYIKDHPKGWYKELAMDEKLWLVAGKSTNPRDFDEYVQKRPYGRYADKARQLALYYKAKNTGEIQPYEEYYKRFPQGTYKQEISDSLRKMYLRAGDMAMSNKNPDEAERMFRAYDQAFSSGDTANIIQPRLEAVQNMRREVAEEQQRMQREQQKNQMIQDLRRERGRRNGKIVKTTIWTAVAAGGAFGAYYFGQEDNLWPGIGCGVLAGLAIIGIVDGIKDVNYYQRHVRSIRRDLRNNFSLLPAINPMDNTFGMVLKFKF